jgi:pimeloyl-ACP methyl ester carboxylesterase
MAYGHGNPLLLIHGLAGSTKWWSRNVDGLSRGNSLYLLDLPGFGSMRKHAKHFSIATSANWVGRVLSGLNLHRAAIVGHSMGSLIAALFAAHHPDRVSRLVLAAPAIALPQTSVWPFVVPLMTQAFYVHPAFLPTLVRDAAFAGPVALMRAARELLLIDTKSELSRIESPSLLLFGERDPLVPASLAQTLASQIRNSEFRVLSGAGHILMYDRAELFNTAVLDFLSAGK